MNNLLKIALFILITSCNGQKEKDINEVVFESVKEITIHNKVECSMHNLIRNSITVRADTEINKIIKSITNSEKIYEKINSRANNGFFEIVFKENNTIHNYTINYTVYSGVIIRDDNNGDLFRNDELEGIIYQLFIAK